MQFSPIWKSDSLFSATQKAAKDVWFVGDAFLNKIFHMYNFLRRQVKLDNRTGPYLLDQYNVTALHCDSQISSVIAKLQIAVVNELNQCDLLPRMIVVFPDHDILKSDKIFDFGISHICDKNLSWLISEIDKGVSAKKEAMRKIRRGAVTASEPKMVYVKMLDQPHPDKAQAIRRKFNDLLEEKLLAWQNHFILHIEVENSLFNITNHLTTEGEKQYWHRIDALLEDFDYNKDKFKPAAKQHGYQDSRSDGGQRFHLPPLMPGRLQYRH